MLNNRHKDKQRATTRHRRLNKNWKSEQFDIEIKDYSFDEFLINWLDDKTDDEIMNFYKEIIFLVIHNKTISGLIEELNMKGNTFYKHYNKAKEILKHDYITSTDSNIFFGDTLV